MKAGKLRYFVHVTRRRPGLDDVGQPSNAFDQLFDTWADVEPITGKEYFAAGTFVAVADSIITMRYLEETKIITAQDRVTVDGDSGGVYDVQTVLPTILLGKDLKLMARRLA